MVIQKFASSSSGRPQQVAVPVRVGDTDEPFTVAMVLTR